MARGNADIAEGGFLSDATGLRAESWAAGLERDNIFGGKIRLTARRAAAFTGGRAKLHYTEADGDFTRAFYAGVSGSEEYKRKAAQTLHRRELELNLAGGKPPLAVAVGYARQLQNGGEFALGAEHAENKTALSAQFRLEF
ncbi:MAG: hypothetical protein HAW59_07310 [Betaproteobacteria bacterium]|nr:hypothetical protein [Betaproteobacteria bacterium]